MPFSPLDALMQVATPKRSLEPSPRNDGPGAFAPALEQAYQADSSCQAPAPRPVEQKPKPDDSTASGEQDDAEHSADDLAAVAEQGDAASAATEQEASDAADAESEDAVEISAEGAAAVGIVQEAKSVEQQVVVKSGDAETDAGEVKEVDAKAAAEAAKKQADAAADAAALQEGATEENAPAGETASDEAEEIVVSTLNSTRRRQSGDERKRDDAATGTAADGEKKTSETPVAPNAASEGGENGEVEQVEEVVADTPAETNGESRERSDAEETAAKSEETKHIASKVEAASASEATAAAAATAAENAEASAADVADSTAAPATVDSTASTIDASPRTSGALDRLMAGHALKSSKETNEPNGMPTVDRARFVQRVEGAMKAAQQRDGKIQVRLSPPDLGSIKIELAVQNGVLSAKLEAETPAARNLLLDSLPALRERLAQQDIRVDKFDVDVRDQGGNAGSGQADDRTADQSGERQSGRPRPAAARAVALPATSSRSLAGASSAASGLDVRV